jgi:hypothetical protein
MEYFEVVVRKCAKKNPSGWIGYDDLLNMIIEANMRYDRELARSQDEHEKFMKRIANECLDPNS